VVSKDIINDVLGLAHQPLGLLVKPIRLIREEIIQTAVCDTTDTFGTLE
jgi:hypothetical protein